MGNKTAKLQDFVKFTSRHYMNQNCITIGRPTSLIVYLRSLQFLNQATQEASRSIRFSTKQKKEKKN